MAFSGICSCAECSAAASAFAGWSPARAPGSAAACCSASIAATTRAVSAASARWPSANWRLRPCASGWRAAEPALFGLDLRGQTVLLGAQLHDGRRDRGLSGGALLTARRIQLAVGARLLGSGGRQFFRQAGDLLGIGAGVDALAEPCSTR